MQVVRITTLVLCLALLSGPATAEEEPDSGVRIYVGLSGAAGWMPEVEDEFSNSTVDSNVDSDPGLGGAATYGARFAAPFSVEIDFEFIQGIEIKQTSALGSGKDDIFTYSLTSNVAYHPLDMWFDPYVSLGAGWMHVELDDDGSSGDGLALRAGVGVDFWIADHFGLRMEGRYLFPVTDEVRDFDLFGPRVGLFYRF